VWLQDFSQGSKMDRGYRTGRYRMFRRDRLRRPLGLEKIGSVWGGELISND